MDTAIRWTGQKARLLQETLGLSIREFARKLGVDPRTVTKWRKHGESLTCNDEMQEVLSRTLDLASDEQRETFYSQLARQPAGTAPEPGQQAGPFVVVSHKFIPAYVGSRLRPVFEKALPHPEGPGGLEQRVLPLEHPAGGSATAHLLACGVAVVHLAEELTLESITELALWRYRTYPTDRAWVGAGLNALLEAAVPGQPKIEDPQYVLSVYELREQSWPSSALPTALHLLTTPSVLVNRQNPEAVEPIGPHVETEKFTTAWTHPDVVAFHGGSSPGLAGWSGVTYHPQPDERALTVREIVALEVDVQGLWALSSQVLDSIEDGEDPVMPEEYGWRYLRGAYSRLRASRPAETAQHRAMREAVLSTSDLPDRLRDAQEALRDSRV
ncbi:helix-turn-helix domain-containing protein [Kitasatospora aureofaciens]|uniref:Transcriptional regulator n=1 Tax=Kitasatospora aureofaciens TaxID=1894 RepID=A0A1E7NES8_KITAU|nr:helix-turn-helix domain-containing protein [Kitasatospora aureofaciens]OEV38993.1 transcriptional regulator [Kitasatospora aureofaciens]GGU99362.1 transcriptional regulator [Kitasatospora aureofaciens]